MTTKKRPEPLPKFISIPVSALAQTAWFLWGGLFCWIPLIVRVQLWSSVKLAEALRKGKHRVAAAAIRKELRLAATFYVDGVASIHYALFPLSVSAEREAQLEEEEKRAADPDQCEETPERRARALMHVLWSALFWILLFSPVSGLRWLGELAKGVLKLVGVG